MNSKFFLNRSDQTLHDVAEKINTHDWFLIFMEINFISYTKH